MTTKREEESLLHIYTWCIDLETKRWCISEYLATKDYRDRYKFLLTFLKNYFEHLLFTSKHVNTTNLPFFKFLRAIVKEYVHTRWFNLLDDSKNDKLCILSMLRDTCVLFNTLKDLRSAVCIFWSMFSTEKITDKNGQILDSDKQNDLACLITCAVSFPCPLLLEATAIFVHNQTNAAKPAVEFRLGSHVFYECCHVILGGTEALINLVSTAPKFMNYVLYSVCKKLGNKLRTIFPFRNSTVQIAANFESHPNPRVITLIKKIISEYSSILKPSDNEGKMNLPDILHGECRDFVYETLSPLDDLMYISVGYVLWINSLSTHSKLFELEYAFEELHSCVVDLLTSFEIKESHEEQKTSDEEGELEVGEILDVVSDSVPQNESSSHQIKITSFLTLVLQNIHPKYHNDTLERYAEILLALNKGQNALNASDLKSIKDSCEKYRSNKLLNDALNYLSENMKH